MLLRCLLNVQGCGHTVFPTFVYKCPFATAATMATIWPLESRKRKEWEIIRDDQAYSRYVIEHEVDGGPGMPWTRNALNMIPWTQTISPFRRTFTATNGLYRLTPPQP